MASRVDNVDPADGREMFWRCRIKWCRIPEEEGPEMSQRR